MLRNLKTPAGIALLMTLTACGSVATKQSSNSHNTILAPSLENILSPRAEADYDFIRGDVLSREGYHQRAIELFEQVVKLDPSPAVYLRLASEYQKVDKLDQAISSAEKAVTKDPKNLEARFVLGGLYSLEKSFDKAITQYNVVLSLEPHNSEAMIYIASSYASKKDFIKAEQHFNSLLKDPRYETPHIIHYYLGVMHVEQKGAKAEAAAEIEFKKSLKIKPTFEGAVISLAELYLKQNKKAKALELCVAFQKHDRFSPKVADIVAQVYIDKGDLNKAYEQLDYIAANSGSAQDAELKMALILIKNKRYEQATEKLTDMLAKYPKADSARYYLAAVQEESGQVGKAIENYQLLPQTSEYYNEATAHAAFLLKGQGKINQALEMTAQGLKGKADPQVYIIHASLLDAKSDFVGAARSLETGLTKYSKNTEIRFQYAIMLDRLGKKDAMTLQLKKVLELDPYHIQSMSYLAFTMAERNQNLTEAEGLARQASDLAPQDGYVLDTLGWVLYKQKKFPEAIKVLEKAYKYQPTAGIIAEHLADAYSMQSETKKAKDMYNKAAGLTTDELRATQIRNKLQKLLS